ncbi:MAG: hypothetical protein APF77_00475 [Clostridia bacterium BRH_c25]|nr:MAG: hypothetical protein APF77_00475 [Clostridia bacterium BRH_c25]
MKVILRKNDSATSLLLFLYNNYLNLYNKDTIKLSVLLEIMKVFGKSETATRMSLSRTVKAGILINQNDNSEVYYSLAPSGKEAIGIWNEGINQFWGRYALRNKTWDKKWYLINLEFREEHKENRTVILGRLQQNGFGVLSTNTWITPYYLSNQIQKMLSEFDMNTEVIEMYGEMTVYQDIQYFVENVFHLKKLKKSYESFIETFKEKLEETKKIYKEEWFIEGGHSLPLLRALGHEFFYIASEDAMLPRELHPKWVGDEAAQLMIEFRSILLEATIKYLGKLD